MRINSGIFARKTLTDCSKFDLRPTTNKNKQALFNILQNNKFAFNIQKSKGCDLCCGSGIIGFEALSLGAESILFADNNRQHLRLVEKNAEILQVENAIQIIFADVTKMKICNQKFDWLFLDPPYNLDYNQIINELYCKKWLQQDCLIIIEWGRNSIINYSNFSYLHILDIRKYSETFFGFFKLK